VNARANNFFASVLAASAFVDLPGPVFSQVAVRGSHAALWMMWAMFSAVTGLSSKRVYVLPAEGGKPTVIHNGRRISITSWYAWFPSRRPTRELVVSHAFVTFLSTLCRTVVPTQLQAEGKLWTMNTTKPAIAMNTGVANVSWSLLSKLKSTVHSGCPSSKLRLRPHSESEV
jgi:hypothetical protein